MIPDTNIRERAALAIAAIAVLVVALVGIPSIRADSEPALTFAQTQTGQPLTFSQVYENVSPSVVAVNVTTQAGGGEGSGFVLDQDGHIITNNHVVDGADRIEVEFFDGTLARAEVVGTDPDSDLAVIQVDLPKDKLHPVEFADSSKLVVGQEVLAIGSPFGEEWTLTSGIVSALNRTIRGLTNFSIGGVIQTDASINPGNSGGPLLDLNGHVIGVNSQIVSSSRSSAGVGFAIPANLTQRVVKDLIENGKVDYSYIGISGGDVNLSLIEALNLPNDVRGVVVGQVMPDGPGADAGLQDATIDQSGTPTSVDIITKIDSTQLHGMDDLINYLFNYTHPGQHVKLTVLRNGHDEVELDVVLGAREQSKL